MLSEPLKGRCTRQQDAQQNGVSHHLATLRVRMKMITWNMRVLPLASAAFSKTAVSSTAEVTTTSRNVRQAKACASGCRQR
eukprot:3771657-Pleurochrysis_carterae.AAC.1